MTILNRRLGRFGIPFDLINKDRKAVQAMLSDVIVIEARPRMDLCSIEYMALSEHFDWIEPGFEAPEYMAIASPFEGDVRIEWVQIP